MAQAASWRRSSRTCRSLVPSFWAALSTPCRSHTDERKQSQLFPEHAPGALLTSRPESEKRYLYLNFHRDELDAINQSLYDFPKSNILIVLQTCCWRASRPQGWRVKGKHTGSMVVFQNQDTCIILYRNALYGVLHSPPAPGMLLDLKAGEAEQSLPDSCPLAAG